MTSRTGPTKSKPNTKRPCRCGCGFDDLRPPRNYRSGHDRKHVEALVRRFHSTAKPLRDGVLLVADAQLSRPLYLEFLRRIDQGEPGVES